MKKTRRHTRLRMAHEAHHANLDWKKGIMMAQKRANLRMERDRLHGMLYTHINPGLIEQVRGVRGEITRILGD